MPQKIAAMPAPQIKMRAISWPRFTISVTWLFRIAVPRVIFIVVIIAVVPLITTKHSGVSLVQYRAKQSIVNARGLRKTALNNVNPGSPPLDEHKRIESTIAVVVRTSTTGASGGRSIII